MALVNSVCLLGLLWCWATALFPERLHASDVEVKPLEERWASAISNDRGDLIEKMLGVHAKEQGDPLELLQTDAPNDKSALMVAAKLGNLVLVEQMVRLGASINEVTLTSGTPFMFAVLGNHIEVASWLDTKGADSGAKGWSAATIAGAAVGSSGPG